jgi:ATP-dependent DNA helicase RecG
MTPVELNDLLQQGEGPLIEFKRDDIRQEDVAKELVAFLNLNGGTLLLGVEDNGEITGVVRDDLASWVSQLCRTKIDPPIIPALRWYRHVGDEESDVLAVEVSSGTSKPYARIHNNRRTYYIRVGENSEEASAHELQRMFQASGALHYGIKPVVGATLDSLDLRRLNTFFGQILNEEPPDQDDRLSWERRLKNFDLMIESAGQHVATVDGLLLFGRDPKRFLPQSGIRAIAYPGDQEEYASFADEDLKGAMTPILSASGAVAEAGLVEMALDFVRRMSRPETILIEGRRVEQPVYPDDVLREVIVNAMVHRDYSIEGAEIMLSVFSDRLEVTSPGRLPNTVTEEGMRQGMRYTRNQTLVNIMRDYGFVESRGMGIRRRVIPGMKAHNETEPEIIVEEHRVTIRLLSRRPEQPVLPDEEADD